MTDERQPKPNVAVADLPGAAEQPVAVKGPVEQPVLPKPAPVALKGPTKPKEPKPAATRRMKAEPPLKLPRVAGELQRLVLVSLPTISITELAERLDVTRPTASRTLHSLTSTGLVTPADGQDRGWKSAWKLTKLGERVAAELSFDSVRRVHGLIVDRPHNLPAAAEEIMADAETALGSLL